MGLRPRPLAMWTADKPCRLKRATRSATVVPLRKPASRAAWINTPVRATASNAVARRTWSTRSLLLLAMRCKATRSVRLRRRKGSRCGVGIRSLPVKYPGKDSSSGHFRHDPLDEVLRSRRRHIEYVMVTEAAEGQGPTPTAPLPSPSQTEQDLAIRRTRRSARWDEVRALRAAGYGIARIARELGMHRRTVRRYLATAAPPRNRQPEQPKPSGLTSPTLQPFVDYLHGRWQAGCTNVAQLQRELEAQGYQGSYSLLMQALMPWRGPRPPPEPGRGRRRGRPRIKRVNVRWLCLRPPEQLEPHEKDALQEILDGDERLATGYELLQRFRRLIVRRSVRDLDQWLEDAATSELRPFASLSRGIQADRDAVVNGLTLAWSTGPVEGTVTRIKLIKRQGYGRASTQLLRRRIISAA